ncbi:MAG TPA: formylglycine-generating enzyme family protein, partial [Planctomycetaceae bacterium]|nr:formylglycine-generating enzyme family protein [Planctomycetaceae bacterium]
AVSVCSLLSGCGGEKAEKKPPLKKITSSSAREAAAPVVLKPKQGSSNPNIPQLSSGAAGQRSQASALPPGVSPEDVFRESDSDHGWKIAATGIEQAKFVVAAIPSPGQNSSTFLNPDAVRRTSPGTRPAVTIPIAPAQSSGRFALPKGFKAVSGAEVTDEGLPKRILNEADDSEMVLIPEGTFLRGSRNGPDNTRPRHKVFLDAYYISLHEVTLKQFAAYERAMESEQRRSRVKKPLNAEAALNFPALGVSLKEADDYAKWAKCSLPTEAQWEKAARGPEGAPYAWGEGRPVWSRARDRSEILAVMSWRTDVSYYGLFDMAGNAREWCLDLYFPDIYKEAGERGELLLENPANRRSRGGIVDRVIRGGSPDWYVWYRESGGLSAQIPDVGFRCVLNLPKAAAEEAGTN